MLDIVVLRTWKMFSVKSLSPNTHVLTLESSSVASFLVLGGGGARPRNVPTKKIYVLMLRERAKRASA